MTKVGAIAKVTLHSAMWLITSFLPVFMLLPLSLAAHSAFFFFFFFTRAFSGQKSLLYLCLALGHLIFY